MGCYVCPPLFLLSNSQYRRFVLLRDSFEQWNLHDRNSVTLVWKGAFDNTSSKEYG